MYEAEKVCHSRCCESPWTAPVDEDGPFHQNPDGIFIGEQLEGFS